LVGLFSRICLSSVWLHHWHQIAFKLHLNAHAKVFEKAGESSIFKNILAFGASLDAKVALLVIM
jgi:hypothetical protein